MCEKCEHFFADFLLLQYLAIFALRERDSILENHRKVQYTTLKL